MENAPVIKAPATKTYNVKQSKYDVVPKVPFKSVIYAPVLSLLIMRTSSPRIGMIRILAITSALSCSL